MLKLDFEEAVEHLLSIDKRYTRDAYFFVRDGLEYTMKLRKRKLGKSGHVTGQELCEGLRQFALKQYGPMVPTVFEYCGLQKTDDFGEIVWSLVEMSVFGKTEGDSKEDFKAVFDFEQAFVVPFRMQSTGTPPPTRRRGGLRMEKN